MRGSGSLEPSPRAADHHRVAAGEPLGFTQDDVDWEARFTGDDGPGFVIGLRPDLPLDGVRRAVADGVGPLRGSTMTSSSSAGARTASLPRIILPRSTG